MCAGMAWVAGVRGVGWLIVQPLPRTGRAAQASAQLHCRAAYMYIDCLTCVIAIWELKISLHGAARQMNERFWSVIDCVGEESTVSARQ